MTGRPRSTAPRHAPASPWRGLILSIMCAALAGAFALPPSQALAQSPAQSPVRRYDIPAGPLADTLVRFGRESGVLLATTPALTEGVVSPGVQGNYSIDGALAALLAGTGLEHHPADGGGYRLRAAARSGAQVKTLLPVSVFGQADQLDAAYRASSSVSLITREELDRVAPSSPGDIFKTTPGVVSGMNRNGAAIDVNIRGAQGMNRVRTMIDGTVQSSSTWRGYQGVDDRTFIDPDLIGGVTIEKGPSAGAHGAGAIGGVVAIRTLNADDIIPAGQAWGVRLRTGIRDNAISSPPPVTAEQRSHGDSLFDFKNGSGSLALGTRQERFDIVAAITRRHTGNYLAGKRGATEYTYIDPTTGSPVERQLSFTKPGEEVFNTSQNVTSSLLKTTLRLAPAHTVELGYLHYDNEYGEAMPSLIGNSDQTLRQINLSRTSTNTYTSRYRWQPEGDLIDLRANLWATTVADHTRSAAPAPAFPQFGYIPADDPRSSRTRTYGAEVSNQSKLRTSAGLVHLEYGGSYSQQKSGGDPYFSRTYSRDTPVIMSPVAGERAMTSVFGRAQWTLNPWLAFNAGVRRDSYRMNGEQTVAPTGLAYTGTTGQRLNPQAGITVTPWEPLQFYALYSEGMRPPTLRETTYTDSLLAPNPGLRHEVAKNWEFGSSYVSNGLISSGDKLRLKAAFFRNNYHDYIARVTNVGNTSVAYYTTENLDKAAFRGFELSGNYDGRLWFAQAAVTYYDKVEFCRSGRSCTSGSVESDYAINHIPSKIAASLTVGARLLEQSLVVGTRVTHAGRAAVRQSANTRLLTSVWAPYTVVDLFGSYQFNKQWSMNVSAENLFDRYYVDAMNNSAMPSPGKTFRVDVTARF